MRRRLIFNDSFGWRFLRYRSNRQRNRWFFRIIVCLVLGSSFAMGFALVPTRASTPSAGLVTALRGQGPEQVLIVQSPGRFELHLDEAGIVAWYDLRRDALRQNNLVLSDSRLLEHRLRGDTSRFSGALTVHEQTPVRTRVAWQGHVGSPSQPFTLEYTIWVGGQIAITLSGPGDMTTRLNRNPAALTGASLQQQAFTRAEGTTIQAAMLFLDAWTGDDHLRLHSSGDLADDSMTYDIQNGTIQLQAQLDQALHMTIPEGMALRQPRFEIASWPGPEVTLRRGDTLLVAGADYLAHWDEANERLLLQYLHLLSPGGSSAERSFELSATPAVASLALGIAGKDINEAGLLMIDGNMPANDGMPSAPDIFATPYIQSSPVVTATAIAQGAPPGSQIQFLLNGIVVETVPGTSGQTTFTLPAMGEYRLEARLLDAANMVLDRDSIDPLGYGHMLMSIGDSITAGKWGNYVLPDTPVTSYKNSPLSSVDRRNIYQYDNSVVSSGNYYRGYQIDLNDNLTACGNAPVFILNDGVSSLRAYGPNTRNNSAQSKVAAYNDHIDRYGIRHILLMLGTNDANDGRSADAWQSAMISLIIKLQKPTANRGLITWVSHAPWRPDRPESLHNETSLVEKYSGRVPAVVKDRNRPAYPTYEGPNFYVSFRDNQQLLDNEFNDTLHPNQEGFTNMALLWANAICPRFPQPIPTPTSTLIPTTPPTATATATTPPTATATATTPPTATVTATTPPTATATATTPPAEQPVFRVRVPIVLR
ncbi:MAG: GDSL-type esterase/lipase family protein [Chloroflexales bacterium]|nr:GDSL-type esterase/lipase family protein [Chloroflexales bacterium]